MKLCQLMTKMYRHKTLDTFVRGLRDDLSRLLGMKQPTDLPYNTTFMSQARKPSITY